MHHDNDGPLRRRAGDAALTFPPAPSQPAAFLAALATRRAAAQGLAVLAIRIDRFDHAVGTIGPQRADRLRTQIGARIASRLGGRADIHWLGERDLAVAAALPSADIAQRCAGISTALARPYVIDGFELFLSCSIGVAPDQPDRATEHSLQLALDAMLQVCRRGGGGIAGAESPTPPAASALVGALPQALARGEFTLQLQPHALFATGRVKGYTARLRWQSATLGRVSPQDFVPAIEALGLMRETGRWMHQHLLSLMQASAEVAPLQFTMLASSGQLHRAEMVDMLRRSADTAGIAPGRLRIEIPLAALPVNERVAAQCRLLRESGIALALSDFAGDAAGRAALEQLQPETVMLDMRQPGQAVPTPEVERRWRAACECAHAAGVKVCATGIESRQQLEAAREWGCDGMQGHLLAQPFPARWLIQTHAAIELRARELLGEPDARATAP